ncbi:MAG: S8 family serine peptidase, partial [Bdellovibrionota bacterium]
METKLTPDPPSIREHHLSFPEGVARVLGASRAHDRGFQGQGIRIAVIDSGFFPHPFFLSRGFYIRYVPTRREPEPQVDEYGHGTAQLASVFSVAPRAEVLAIKCLDRDPSYALKVALALSPDIISCAWGFDIDRAGLKKIPAGYRKIQQLIQEVVSSGICLVSAAGNGQRSFPGNMPEVLSVGGVYYGPDGNFESSDISSVYESGIYPGRQVPDVCGLTGKRPHGRLLLVPVPPKAQLARKPAFSTMGAGDVKPVGAAGWAMFSGTSAATA